jgi:uncharacterized membrane protein
MSEAKAEIFSITLYPHRSLSRFGLKLVIGSIIAGNLVVAAFFWNRHVWPVFGFMGLDVLLVIGAFWLNNRAARGHERIIVDGDDVRLIRHDGVAESEWRFNRRWLRLELEHDEARDLVGRLLLHSHGKAHQIAAFMGGEERKALARQLRAAFAVRRV